MNLYYKNYIDYIEKFFDKYNNETFIILNETNDYDEFYELLSDFAENNNIPAVGLIINVTKILKKAGINPDKYLTIIPESYHYNNLEIPNTVSSISDWVFLGCDNLKSIKFNGTKEEWKRIYKVKLWRKESVISEVICTNGIVKYSVD